MTHSGDTFSRRWHWLVAAVVVLTVVFAAGSFIHHVNTIKAVTRATFESRLQLTRQFMAVSSAVVAVMRDRFVDAYTDVHFDTPLHLTPLTLPGPPVWEASTRHGTTTGDAAAVPDDSLWRQLNAADRMSTELNTVLSYSPEVAWLYFLSDRGFLHLMPRAPVTQVAFSPKLFERAYWRQSVPAANPDHRVILAGPYDDIGGKGQVLTIAVPVYDGTVFLGITALDMRIDSLTNVLNVGMAAGTSYLINEKDRLVAAQTSIRIPASDTVAGLQTSGDWYTADDGDLQLAGDVVEGELWMIHHLPLSDLYLTAARDSSGTWLGLLLTVVLCGSGFRMLALLRQIARMTYHDALTGLPNRRLLEDRLQMALPAAIRAGQRTALLFIDLDKFKPVNDQYGHAAGDWLLKQAALRMRHVLRAGDTVARMGGDEFVVLLPALPNAADAITAAEKLRLALERPFIHDSHGPIRISSSIGVALSPDHAREAGELLRFGDEAMYEAKKSGRNRVSLFSDQTAPVSALSTAPQP